MAKDTQLLKGILEGCVLAVIAREVTYGYRVIEALQHYGFNDVQEATVYPILNRLNKKGQLSSEKRPSEIGPPRKYYSLTREGQEELEAFRESWLNVRDKVDNLLEVQR